MSRIRPQNCATCSARRLPEFAPPKVEVQTEAPGLSTEEVEALISMPIENALNGTRLSHHPLEIGTRFVISCTSFQRRHGHLQGPPICAGANCNGSTATADRRSSASDPATSFVAQPGDENRLVVKDSFPARSQRARSLDDPSQADVNSGVANVAIWGQRDRQFQVLVNPDQMRAQQVTLDQVIRATQDATMLESGGYLDKPNQRLAIRHRSSVQSLDDLAHSGRVQQQLSDSLE